MTIIHKGIRRKTTDVLGDYGQAYYAQNWRFKRMGEIGRRPGLGKSNMAQLAGPVQAMICGNLYFPYLVQVNDTGDVEATLNPLPEWAEPVMAIPDGIVGQASAPVINSVALSPASPSGYVVGQVTFTADITYDGLSGPLIYLWSPGSGPGGPPDTIINNANPGIFDFTAACIPGVYSGFSLLVTTTAGGFSDFFPGIDYEVL